MRLVFVVAGGLIGVVVAGASIFWGTRWLGSRLRPSDLSADQWDLGMRRFAKVWVVVTIALAAVGFWAGAVVPIH